jgi:hypothetical protein
LKLKKDLEENKVLQKIEREQKELEQYIKHCWDTLENGNNQRESNPQIEPHNNNQIEINQTQGTNQSEDGRNTQSNHLENTRSINSNANLKTESNQESNSLSGLSFQGKPQYREVENPVPLNTSEQMGIESNKILPSGPGFDSDQQEQIDINLDIKLNDRLDSSNIQNGSDNRGVGNTH